jgi:hypothetical protein
VAGCESKCPGCGGLPAQASAPLTLLPATRYVLLHTSAARIRNTRWLGLRCGCGHRVSVCVAVPACHVESRALGPQGLVSLWLRLHLHRFWPADITLHACWHRTNHRAKHVNATRWCVLNDWQWLPLYVWVGKRQTENPTTLCARTHHHIAKAVRAFSWYHCHLTPCLDPLAAPTLLQQLQTVHANVR